VVGGDENVNKELAHAIIDKTLLLIDRKIIFVPKKAMKFFSTIEPRKYNFYQPDAYHETSYIKNVSIREKSWDRLFNDHSDIVLSKFPHELAEKINRFSLYAETCVFIICEPDASDPFAWKNFLYNGFWLQLLGGSSVFRPFAALAAHIRLIPLYSKE
jgi:hypothetical protein